MFLRNPTNTLELVNVILLHSNNLYISATHVGIFRLMRATLFGAILLCIAVLYFIPVNNTTIYIYIYIYSDQY